jgi:hypothetical protein
MNIPIVRPPTTANATRGQAGNVRRRPRNHNFLKKLRPAKAAKDQGASFSFSQLAVGFRCELDFKRVLTRRI